MKRHYQIVININISTSRDQEEAMCAAVQYVLEYVDIEEMCRHETKPTSTTVYSTAGNPEEVVRQINYGSSARCRPHPRPTGAAATGRKCDTPGF
jgi:hypothetical protein